jgi:suppressor for copper-sensitivity B
MEWMRTRLGLLRVLGLAIGVAAVAAPPLPALSGAWVETPHSKARLVSRWSAAPRGGDAGLGVEFALAPGWHVYWKNSGDAGFPPRLELGAPPGLGPATLRFPAPHRFDLAGGLVSFGYETGVVYPLDADLAADAPAALRLRAHLDYLVCAAECIPYRADLALDLPVADAGTVDAGLAPEIDRWRSRLPRPASAAGADLRVTTQVETGAYPWSTLELALAAPGLRAASPDLFFAPQDRVELARPERVATADSPRFRVRFRALDETRPLPGDFAVEWTATGLELAGAPLALEGHAPLGPAAAAAKPARRLSLPIVAALGLLIGALAALLRRRYLQVRQGVPR